MNIQTTHSFLTEISNEHVKRMKKFYERSNRNISNSVGGSCGFFDLKSAGYSSNTILVAGTDGVGTKLEVKFRVVGCLNLQSSFCC